MLTIFDLSSLQLYIYFVRKCKRLCETYAVINVNPMDVQVSAPETMLEKSFKRLTNVQWLKCLSDHSDCVRDNDSRKEKMLLIK